MKCLMFDKDCDLLTCQSKGKCLWNDDFEQVTTENKTKSCNNTNVLSSFATRCMVLINQGHNTFTSGWYDAIIELVAAGRIEIFKYEEGYTTISKIS